MCTDGAYEDKNETRACLSDKGWSLPPCPLAASSPSPESWRAGGRLSLWPLAGVRSGGEGLRPRPEAPSRGLPWPPAAPAEEGAGRAGEAEVLGAALVEGSGSRTNRRRGLSRATKMLPLLLPLSLLPSAPDRKSVEALVLLEEHTQTVQGCFSCRS